MKLTCLFSGCPGCGRCLGGPAQPRSPTVAGQWSWWSQPEENKLQVIHNIHHPENLFHHTWDFSTLALSLSHMADTSRPSAFSWNQAMCQQCLFWLLAPLTAHPVSLRPELVHEPVHPLLVQLQRLGRVGEVRAVDHILENLGKFKSACQVRTIQIPIKLPGSCR